MIPLKLSTAITIPIFAEDSTTGAPVTGITDGQWITKRIDKNGAGFNDMTVTITEMSNGWYELPLSTTHTNTLGSLTLSFGATGVKQVNIQFRVSTLLIDDLIDAIWDEVRADHDIAGTFGNAIQERNSAIIDIIEANKGHHGWHGDIYYVAPTNGSDLNNGSRSMPFATVSKALTSVNPHDLILLVPDNPSGQTVLSENVTITVPYVLVRGLGRNFLWNRTSPGDVITVNADGVELSGFELRTHTTGSGVGIVIDGANNSHVHDVFLSLSRGTAITITDGDQNHIERCVLRDVGQGGSGHGIEIDSTGGANTANLNMISYNEIYDAQGDGIRLKSASTVGTIVKKNNIHGSTGYGINVQNNVTDSNLLDNKLHHNTSGTINDDGTRTAKINNEQWAKAGSTADDLDDLLVGITELQNISKGRWEMTEPNTMSFYDSGDNLIISFNTFNKDGIPALFEVFKRVPI
jgi:hypothetical protein